MLAVDVDRALQIQTTYIEESALNIIVYLLFMI